MSSRFKQVSISKSISIAIFSAIALLIFCFVPISFGTEDGVIFTYNTLPIISDASFVEIYANGSLVALQTVIPAIPNEVMQIIYMVFSYGVPTVMIIFAVNFVSGILLAITRANFLRVLFKIVGIFMGIAMIFATIMFLVYVVGCVCMVISGIEILTALQTSGFIVAFVMIIISSISAKKNFTAFNLA